MLNLPASDRIYFCVLPIDMRRSFDSLAELAREQMGEEPMSGHLFLFRNKTEDCLKVLYWDRDGYAIWYKRLQKRKFSLPAIAGKSLEVDATTFSMLLNGLDRKSLKRQKRYSMAKKESVANLNV
ncbi:MAG: IS66 family insertion sequence element accessory protein TnpB [Candidatus Obscuribacterales bacterium]|nr:IS66 family insertion sequence element accessory protein TnpB [Candidatus Obscuribacterales bacterium]